MHTTIAIYGLLLAAIVTEVFGASFLELTNGLTNLRYLALSLISYAISFFLSVQVLKVMPVGIMYAIWCGVGICLIGVVGYFVNGQGLDKPALIGMTLIGAGVIVIHVFSKSVAS